MPPAPLYYIRHGVMHHVGRFADEGGIAPRRGEIVVVRSRRGEELGEVVGPCPEGRPTSSAILRLAGREDHERARAVASDRSRRLAACDEFFRDGEWPIQPIDAEPMLDGDRTVLLYLGPHRLEASGLAQAIQAACGLDLVFEPVGLDEADEAEAEASCGSCGSGGGCGDGGGCGSEAGGCSGCSVKDLVRSRQGTAAV